MKHTWYALLSLCLLAAVGLVVLYAPDIHRCGWQTAHKVSRLVDAVTRAADAYSKSHGGK